MHNKQRNCLKILSGFMIILKILKNNSISLRTSNLHSNTGLRSLFAWFYLLYAYSVSVFTTSVVNQILFVRDLSVQLKLMVYGKYTTIKYVLEKELQLNMNHQPANMPTISQIAGANKKDLMKTSSIEDK